MEAPLESTNNRDLNSVLSACEPELQELMRQIDLMISHQKREWEAEVRALDMRLKSTEEELLASRATIERRELEIGLLHKQLEDVQVCPQDVVSKYEQQLQKVSEELDKLKRSYHKLQRKQLRQTSGGASRDLSQENPQHPLDREQQRDQHQSQLTEMEALNRSLAQELLQMKAQPASRQHWQCCVELQRLQAELRRPPPGPLPCTPDAVGQPESSGWTLREQQLSEEQEDLHIQESFVQRENQRLQNEAAKLNQMLRAKDQVIRSLEDCLSAQGLAGVENLRGDLEKSAVQLQCSRACEAHLKAELKRTRERLQAVSRGRADRSETEQEVAGLKAQVDSSVAEMKKLREELELARQTHAAEVEGMRAEVAKMTGELHQRDLRIATLSGERAELRMTWTQLETLQKENQHLRDLLQRRQPSSPKRGEAPAASLGEKHTASRGRPEEEDGQSEQTDPRHHASEQTCLAAPARLQIDTQAVRAEAPECTTHREGEIQRLFKELHALSMSPREQHCSQDQDYRPPASSSSSSSSSSSTSAGLTRRISIPSSSPGEFVEDRQSISPGNCLSSASRERRTLSPTSEELSSHGTLSHFLEEESFRSKELLQRLDAHILGMREINHRTVSKYVDRGVRPEWEQTSSERTPV
ncbi:centrosomal protein of 63 kDa isoform X2 [Oryzias latipes]|uniref:centrosomal protein of 63 kDa isoform X2 n=1 Tax=Oryzias latipes TaxID=8090 RepID=UPI0009D9DFD4|nr:centrosomal protein of 63 kDa isoform X2 [Oryzias latipes]